MTLFVASSGINNMGEQQKAQRTICGHEVAVAGVEVAQLTKLRKTSQHLRIALPIWMCVCRGGAVL